jgi:hypothetical protein
LITAFFGITSLFAQAVSYTYDSGGHLVKATYGSLAVTYTYDAAGHLITRKNSGSRCDLNADGQVNVADVQAIINTALGVAPPTTAADLNADGAVNVVDVQTMINVVLGSTVCPS